MNLVPLMHGDLISLQNSRGYLCSPSDKSDPGFVSLSRPCPIQVLSNLEDDDFHRRCLFRIHVMDVNDEKEEVSVKFGSIVQLYSHPMNYVVCGEKDHEGNFKASLKDMDIVPPSNLDAQWIVSSKYKLRQSGENVRDKDYLVFRSVNNPEQKLITRWQPPSEKGTKLRKSDVGFKVDIFQPANLRNGTTLNYGDYIYINHIERSSELIARLDLYDSSPPRYGRIGMISRECMEDSNIKTFFRPVKNEVDDDSHESDHCGTNGLNIWQVVPPSNSKKLKTVTDIQMVCIRHVITGLYLALVPAMKQSSAMTMKKNLNNDKSTKNEALTPRSEYDDDRYEIILTPTRDITTEFMLEQVEKLNRKFSEGINITSSTYTDIASPIPLEEHVVLRHCQTNTYLKATEEYAMTYIHDMMYTKTIEGKKLLQTYGTWGHEYDIPVWVMNQYHISESLQLRRVPLRIVKDIINIHRYQYLLTTTQSYIQLYGTDITILESILPLFTYVMQRTLCFSLWIQAKPEPIRKADSSNDSQDFHIHPNTIINQFEDEEDSDEDDDDDNNGNEIHRTNDTYDDIKDKKGAQQNTSKKEAEGGFLGFINKLLGRNTESESTIKDDSDDVNEEVLNLIRFRQYVICNSHTLDQLINLTNIIFVYIQSIQKMTALNVTNNTSISMNKTYSTYSSYSQHQEPPPLPSYISHQNIVSNLYPMKENNVLNSFNTNKEEKTSVDITSNGQIPSSMTTYISSKNISLDPATAYYEKAKSYQKIEIVLKECADILLRCITCCIQDNLPVRLKLLSSPDVISMWIHMIMKDWRPPIASLMAVSDFYALRLNEGGISNYSVIDSAEMFYIISEMIHLYHSNDLIKAAHLFKLVNILFTSSQPYRTRKLDIVMYYILQVYHQDDIEDHPMLTSLPSTSMKPNDLSSRKNSNTAIGSVISNTDDPIKGTTNTTLHQAEILEILRESMSVNIRKCLWFSVNTTDNSIIDDIGVLEGYPTSYSDLSLKTEILEIVKFIKLYCTHHYSKISIQEATRMILDLGISGPFVYQDVNYIANQSYKSILLWWKLRCKLFLQSTLYNISKTSDSIILSVLEECLRELPHGAIESNLAASTAAIINQSSKSLNLGSKSNSNKNNNGLTLLKPGVTTTTGANMSGNMSPIYEDDMESYADRSPANLLSPATSSSSEDAYNLPRRFSDVELSLLGDSSDKQDTTQFRQQQQQQEASINALSVNTDMNELNELNELPTPPKNTASTIARTSSKGIQQYIPQLDMPVSVDKPTTNTTVITSIPTYLQHLLSKQTEEFDRTFILGEIHERQFDMTMFQSLTHISAESFMSPNHDRIDFDQLQQMDRDFDGIPDDVSVDSQEHGQSPSSQKGRHFQQDITRYNQNEQQERLESERRRQEEGLESSPNSEIHHSVAESILEKTTTTSSSKLFRSSHRVVNTINLSVPDEKTASPTTTKNKRWSPYKDSKPKVNFDSSVTNTAVTGTGTGTGSGSGTTTNRLSTMSTTRPTMTEGATPLGLKMEHLYEGNNEDRDIPSIIPSASTTGGILRRLSDVSGRSSNSFFPMGLGDLGGGRSSQEVRNDHKITLMKVLSNMKFHGDEWLKESVANLTAICDPLNPYVQKLISYLLPPDVLINLLDNDAVKLKYKTIIIDVLSNVYLRRYGVFPSLIITSVSEKLFIGLQSIDSLSVFPMIISDVFNDVASSFSREKGNKLRDILRSYLHSTLLDMSFSIHGDTKLLEFNTKLLKLLKETIQRGLFNGIQKVVTEDDMMPDPTKTYSEHGPLSNESVAPGRVLSADGGEDIKQKKGSLKAAISLSSRSISTTEEIQDLIIQRILYMDPPKEGDTHYSSNVGLPYVRMIDAVIDVVYETVEITKLHRLEMVAQLCSKSKDKPIKIPDTSKEDQKLAKALAILFAALPDYLDPSTEMAQKKVHQIIYSQVNQAEYILNKLNNVCLFQSTEVAIKTRQLSGLGVFIIYNLSYLLDKLKDSDDQYLKNHLIKEIKLSFNTMYDLLSSYELVFTETSTNTTTTTASTTAKNTNTKASLDKKGASGNDQSFSAKIDIMALDGNNIDMKIPQFSDTIQYLMYSYYVIDEFTECYVLDNLVTNLTNFVTPWTHSWTSLSLIQQFISDEIIKFFCSVAYNSKHLTTIIFTHLKVLMLKYWQSDYQLAMLLEICCVHKCEFTPMEIRYLLYTIFDKLHIPDSTNTTSGSNTTTTTTTKAAAAMAASITHLTHQEAQNRSFPLLCALLNIVEIHDNVTSPIHSESIQSSIVITELSNKSNTQVSNISPDKTANSKDKKLKKSSENTVVIPHISQSELTDITLYSLTRLLEFIQGNPRTPDEDREVEIRSPLFGYTLQAVCNFLNNKHIDQTIRQELRVILQETWKISFISLVVRRRDCPVNIRTLLMKLYLELQLLEDFHLISRCFLRSLDYSETGIISYGEKIKLKTIKILEVNNNTTTSTTTTTNVLDKVSTCKMNPGNTSERQLQMSQKLSRQDTAAGYTDLSRYVTIPTFIRYIEDSLYVIGKSVIYYYLLRNPSKDRYNAFHERQYDVEDNLYGYLDNFATKYNITIECMESLGLLKSTHPFKETYEFFNCDQYYLEAPDKFLIHRCLPTLFSNTAYLSVIQQYMNVTTVYNTHLHSTLMKHFIWLATFTSRLIEDHRTENLADVQKNSLEEAYVQIQSCRDMIVRWTLSCRKYTQALVNKDTVHMLLLPIETYDRSDRKKMAKMTNAELIYYQEIQTTQRSLMYKEIYRIIYKLSYQFNHYDGDVKTKIKAAERKNKQVLTTIESLAMKNIFRYIGNYAEPDVATYSFLTVFNALFKQYDCYLSSGQVDKYSLRLLQNTLDILGMSDMLVNLINRLIDTQTAADTYNTKVLSLTLQLSSNILYEGNKLIQNKFLLLCGYDVEMNTFSRTTTSYLISLKKLLVLIVPNSLETIIKPYQYEIISRIFLFCSVLSQQNEKAQDFLRDQQRPESINFITEIAGTMDILIRYFILKMVKREIDHGNITKLPFIWNKDFIKPILAVLNPLIDINYIEEIIMVLKLGFISLKDCCQGPVSANQASATHVLREIPVLLDTIGTYIKDIRPKKKGIIIKRTIDYSKTFQDRDEGYEALVTNKKLNNNMHKLELSVVWFILSLLEGVTQDRIVSLGGLLEEHVLFDNLDRTHKEMIRGKKKNRPHAKEMTVAYLSLLFTIGDAQEIIEDITQRNDNIKLWNDKCMEEGYNINSFLASVEIIDKNGKIDRVYFPIPEFVNTYWSYPEVQAAKEQVMQEVVRTSADEKLTDFYSHLHRMISVMNRQQLLAASLTPFIHALFGGKTAIPPSIQPYTLSQRFLLLAVTLGLNGYYAYDNYTNVNDDLFYQNPTLKDFFGNGFWGNITTYITHPYVILFLIKVLHFALTISLVIRKFLNSRVLDSADFENDPNESPTMKLLKFLGKNLILSPLTLFNLVYDSWWTITLFVMSYLGLFVGVGYYCVCILDAINLIKYMGILVQAVKLNVIKICLTMLLAGIILYQVAVLTFFYFPDEYNFNGMKSCGTDILSCFKLHIDYGLNNPMSWDQNGDVGYINPTFHPFFIIPDPYWEHMASIILGSVYNFIYLVLVNLVLQAIISGYIIDTFGSMRDAQEFIDDDMRSQCFICSIARDDFEQNGIDFIKHIKDEHNAWKYVWYKVHLDRADKKTMSGPEYHSYLQFATDKKFVRLLPVKKSMSLGKRLLKVQE